MPEPAVVACSTLAYRDLPLHEGLARIAALGFASVELAVFDDYTRLGVSELAADPAGVVARVAWALRDAGLAAVSLSTAVPLDAPAVAEQRFAQLLALATAIGAGMITVEAPARGMEVERAARLLAPLAAMACAAGIGLAVETHTFLLTELPTDAALLAAHVPGLGLTLDPAHYTAGPGRGEPLDAVFPHVRNLHVRDAGTTWDDIQLDMGTGVVDFPAIFAALDEQGFAGPCVIEYIGTAEGGGVESNLHAARAYVRERWV